MQWMYFQDQLNIIRKESDGLCPNHIKNVWKIKNIPKDKIDYILNKLSSVESEDTRILDFDLIIPEPRLKQDCPKKFIRTEKSCVMEDKDRPWFNWYDWRLANWNTKWNAYDGYTIVGKTQITFVFNTAWSFPYAVAVELAKQLGYDLELKYADEDYGSNCGIYKTNEFDKTYLNFTDKSEQPDNIKFAKNLWDKY